MNKPSPSARERWQRLVQEQQSSGLPVGRFCRERRIGVSSLFAWKRRLARQAQVSAGPAFLPVGLASAARADDAGGSAGGAIELHMGNGRHFVLRPGFDAPTLAAALRALDGAASSGEGR